MPVEVLVVVLVASLLATFAVACPGRDMKIAVAFATRAEEFAVVDDHIEHNPGGYTVTGPVVVLESCSRMAFPTVSLYQPQ